MSWYDVEEVLNRAELPEVARRLGFELQRKGTNVLTRCPFHDDKRPSLVLYPREASSSSHFHCFSCNAHGHAVDLVKEVKGLDFKSAVAWLGDSFGVMPARRQQTSKELKKPTKEDAFAFAQQVFEESHDSAAFEYWCQERGFEPSILFGMGLRCISRSSPLVRALNFKKLGEQLELIDGLCAAGLLVRLRAKLKFEMQSSLDLAEQFRDYFDDGRILIPISSSSGKVVAYAGRHWIYRSIPTNHDVAPAKYLQTPGFRKAEVLFNSHNAAKLLSAKSAQNLESPTLYVVEGFMDALRLHSLNLPAVAVMGTSVSAEQFKEITQLVHTANVKPGDHLRVRLFFDLDSAGFDGATRAARQLLGLEGAESEWVGFADNDVLSQGKDPDEILKGISRTDAMELCNTKALPVAGLLVASSLGYKNATPLLDREWNGISRYPRERALMHTARTLRALSSPNLNWGERLNSSKSSNKQWIIDLVKYVEHRRYANSPSEELGFLGDIDARLNHARMLAEYGARRGELPCDDEAWRALDRSAPLFNIMTRYRLAMDIWEQAAPADAVNLPRKLSADQNVLKDPRRKVMLHAADLHLQQFLMNELLTERHDFSHEGPRNFSDCIPAVRWFRTERVKRVTGYTKNDDFSPTLKDGESGEPILSFAYQIDMDVLEGRRKPTSQGMFRPYMECWHDFMESLNRQAQNIGSKIYVLRLDAKRYYDNIQRYILRDQLLEQIEEALIILGDNSSAFDSLALPKGDPRLASQRLVEVLCSSLFGYKFINPDNGQEQFEDNVVGIPQGPVISAWMGTIAMFPVDGVARKFIRESRNEHESESIESRPRAGYARYVDDIVLMADSEGVLEDLRSAIVKEASRLSLTLVRKGDKVTPGSPEEIRQQLNKGRILAASVPTWEPPMRGDGEAEWDIDFDDTVPMDRQCALQLLRHPRLLDDPAVGLDMVRDAIRAQNMRVNDLGRCARALWWQVAIMNFSDTSIDRSVEDLWPYIWTQYIKRWREACGGHDWALAFEQSGYDILIAVEGLDMLLDSRMGLENGRNEQWIKRHKSAINKLSLTVLHAERNLGFDPAKNRSHIFRRIEKLKWKAWNLRRDGLLSPSLIPHTSNEVTTTNWLCLAASLLNRNVVNPSSADSRALEPMRLLPQNRCAPEQILELHDILIGNSDRSAQHGANSKNLALQFLVANSPKESRARILSQYPELLFPKDQNLTILPLLPLEGSRLLAFSNKKGTNKISQKTEIFSFRDSKEDVPIQRAFGSRLVHTTAESAEPIVFDWNKNSPKELTQSLWRFQAKTPTVLCFDQKTPVCRAHFAAGIYRVLYEIIQNQKQLDGGKALVPVWSHMAHSAIESDVQSDKPTTWYLIAEPVDRLKLGVMTFIKDGHGGLRSVNVPGGEYADFWRLGCAVSDALNVSIDLGIDVVADNQAVASDETTLGESVEHISQVEEYLLNQQLSKLRGTWIADAQVRDRGEGAIPRTIERALKILENFDADLPEEKKVLQVMYVEAETQSMAMRLKRPGRGDLRGQLHILPYEVLRRIPLRLLEKLPLPGATNEKPLRTDLALLLSLANVLHIEQEALKIKASSSGGAQEPALALCLGVALATITTALRGLVASAWGVFRLISKSKLPISLTVPPTWNAPEDGRLDPQSDYDQIRGWLHTDDWGKFNDATPWQFMLLLLGLLDYLSPDALNNSKHSVLRQVYEHLRMWQSTPSNSESSWAWPFEEIPEYDAALWRNIVQKLPEMVCHVDNLLGVIVEQVEAPTFKRDRNGAHFTDSNGQRWALSLVQITGLGRTDSIARVQRSNSSALLPTWTEVRRLSDRELLSVHTLDDKLGKWIFNTQSSIQPESREENSNPTSSEDTSQNIGKPEDYSQDRSTEEESVHKEENLGGKERGSFDSSEFGKLDLRRRFLVNQRVGWDTREKTKSRSHMRVALFQYCVEESYSHPVAEVGLKGLRMPVWAQDDVLKALKSNSKWKAIDKASKKRGNEASWVYTDKVLSWPEHRRRKLLIHALEACHRLGVDLLVLPEYSVRPSTVDWLSGELRNKFKGLAVLAGTYRYFGESFDYRPSSLKSLSALMAPLSLLWHPSEEISKKLFQSNRDNTLWLERGKKYRAVAANELFNPDWTKIAPLFQTDSLLQQLPLQDICRDGDVGSFLYSIAELMPPLRFCMELICSELFLLTSPANYEPLRNEVMSMIRRFGAGEDDNADKLVEDDFFTLGKHLTVLQRLGAPRRSVLLVPAMSTRSNDYWHAGQASVLASGTATVFCNATNTKFGAGGSCFIGIDSVTNSHSGSPGYIENMTPYHGWAKGILSSRADGALSKSDQALVVADIDPVHVVSGKPRPQLLPVPMALVAYLPVVELLDPDINKNHVYREISGELKEDNDKDVTLKSLAAIASGDYCLNTTTPQEFWSKLGGLQSIERISREDTDLEKFTKLFGDPKAVFERLEAWSRDRDQQPYSPKKELRNQPAWLDILPVDLTLRDGEPIPSISVPPWIDSSESS